MLVQYQDGSYWRMRDGEVRPPDSSVKSCEPELSDPATRGCLLGLVRLCWGPDTFTHYVANEGWAVKSDYLHAGPCGRRLTGLHMTETHALVAALEQAS
jgi:hypothetical protein